MKVPVKYELEQSRECFIQMNDNLTKDDELYKEVYAQFGLAYYLGECLHKELCNIFVIASIQDRSLLSAPRIEEILATAYSLTMGQIIKELDNIEIIPKNILIELENARERRNFLAHHFWFERIHLFASTHGMSKMCHKLQNQFMKIKTKFGLTEEFIQDHLAKIKTGTPRDPWHQQRPLKKQERIIKIWNTSDQREKNSLIFECEDGSLWQLCDIGLGWTYYKEVLSNWKEEISFKAYLPSNINPRPKICKPFCYEFSLKGNMEVWVRPGSKEKTLKWGLREKMESVEFKKPSDNSEQPNVELPDSKVSHEGLQILARILENLPP